MTLPPYPGSGEPPEGEPGNGSTPEGRPSGPSWGSQPPPPPYGQGQPPYGQNPYGQTPYGQQGQWTGPGGYGSYQGPNDPTGQSYSGIAIAALVLSLTCVLSVVGVILGIVGIFRTGRGKAKGRWMAVTAIVVGTLFSLILVAIAAAGVWVGQQFVTPGNAEAGQCLDVAHEGRNVSLTKQDCSERHDAEIFEVHELSDQDITAFDERRLGQVEICMRAAGEQFNAPLGRDFTVDGEDVRIDAVLTDPEDPAAGDKVVCYLEAREGKLDRSLTDR